MKKLHSREIHQCYLPQITHTDTKHLEVEGISDYPSTSVIIDYYLPADIKEGVSLQIMDAQGKEVATIVSDSTKLKSTTETVEDMSLSMTFVYMDEKLETKKDSIGLSGTCSKRSLGQERQEEL